MRSLHKIAIICLLIISVYSGMGPNDYKLQNDAPKEKMDKYRAEGRKNAIERPLLDEKDILHIHIVPHTHDDVGWLKTVDEYYVGAKDNIALAGVQYVLDGIYDQLMKDPGKKFTYVEMAFFYKWWHEQTDEVKENVKMLVKENRLAFVNAGWSMSDESNVYYEDFINNMKAGHDFLMDTFGYKPTIGWHIDPFGHQSASAALFAQMGFDAWFFARGDFRDKEQRLKEKSLEFLWRPFYDNLGNRSEIYTHFLHDFYTFPPGFTWAELWGNDPIVDDPELEIYNALEKAEEFRAYMYTISEDFRTNQIITLFGQDFSYLNSQKTFKNIDKLIKHVNEQYTDIKLFYSTPYDYVNAVHETGIKLPVQYDDMLPYADQPDMFWTGYYTSRANFKSFVKYSSLEFSIHSIFLSSFYLYEKNETKIEEYLKNYNAMYREMGIAQHHDAVSGTAKQLVMDDYAYTLSKALEKMRNQTIKIFSMFFEGFDAENGGMCISKNSTLLECPTKAFLDPNVEFIDLYVINGFEEKIFFPKIILPSGNFIVYYDENEADMICSKDNHNFIIYENRLSPLNSVFPIRISRDTESHCIPPSKDPKSLVQMLWYTIQYKGQTRDGRSEFSYTNTQTEITDTFYIDYAYYDSFQDVEKTDAVSGAYLFRPISSDQKPKLYNKVKDVELIVGENSAVYNIYGDEVTTRLILNFDDYPMKLETELHGIPYTKKGMEVVLRIKSKNIKNKGIFYTDSMGLEMQKRVKNQRPYWDWTVDEEVAGNYYPVNSLIEIHDEERALEVFTDRAQGGASLEDGQIELMIQRRLYVDDWKGLFECLNETNPNSTDGKGVPVTLYHHFRIRDVNISQQIRDNMLYIKNMLETPPLEIWNTKPTDENPKNSYNLFNNSLPNDFPVELKVQMFPENKNSIFFRLENYLDKNFYNKTVYIDFEYFVYDLIEEDFGHKVDSITETSLTGIFNMEEMSQRIKWKGEDFTSGPIDYSSDLQNIALEPQRIRSFRVKFTRQDHTMIEKLLK